jgi:hypothetical protein
VFVLSGRHESRYEDLAIMDKIAGFVNLRLSSRLQKRASLLSYRA